MPEVFYNMYLRKKETVPDNKIKVKKVNCRFHLVGTSNNGKPLYKFASEATAKKYIASVNFNVKNKFYILNPQYVQVKGEAKVGDLFKTNIIIFWTFILNKYFILPI